MKKLLFCLSIGMVAAGCQNSTIVPEGEIRTHFKSYCKLTGGTPDGPDVCVCGNYRCYERACNHTGDGCDNRLCYEGDTKCTNDDNKIGTVEICDHHKYINIRDSNSPHDDLNTSNDGKCTSIATNEFTSCAKSEKKWQASCGECINGTVECDPGEPGLETEDHATITLCKNGRIITAKCASHKCAKSSNDTPTCEICQDDYKYCINNMTYECTNNVPIISDCEHGCNKDLTDCAKCQEGDTTCQPLGYVNSDKDNGIFFLQKKCNEGEWITETLYKDDICKAPDTEKRCFILDDLNDGHPVFFNGTNLEFCAYDCTSDQGCSGNSSEQCTTENPDNCMVLPTDAPPQPTHNQQCEPAKSNEDNTCPNDGYCNEEGICVKECSSEESCDEQCEYIQCNQLRKIYCKNPKKPDQYPYLVSTKDGFELHIDKEFFNSLDPKGLSDTISEYDAECNIQINSIVLHGNETGNFIIDCSNYESISLSGVTKIKGGDSQGTTIRCKDSQQLNAPLFTDVDGTHFENLGIAITFTPAESDPSTPLQGGLANEIKNAKLENIQITGSIICSSDNCGLLAGTVSGTSLDIKGTKGRVINVTSDDAKELKNIGGVIGKLTPTSDSHEIKFNNIHIKDVKGTYNVGGFIGSIGCTDADSCESSTSNITISGSGNTLTGTVNGMKNVGGVIGAASGFSHVTDFGLNENDNNKEPHGTIIGGNIKLYEQVKEHNQKYETAYKSENIGGLIGKLVIPENSMIDNGEDLNTPVSTIKNIIVKLSAVTCSEYNHRSEIECSDNSCDENELCNKQPSQCKYGGGLIGFMDIREIANAKEKVAEQINKIDKYTDTELEKVDVPKINNTILDISNVLLVLDTLSISRYYAGLVGHLGDDPEDFDDTKIQNYINKLSNSSLTSLAEKEIASNELKNISKQHSNSDYYKQLKERLILKFKEIIKAQLRHKYGILSIENVLIAINEVNGRLDIFGRFRGFANNIRVLTELQMSKIFALIKLNDDPENNYCLYKGEYDGNLASSYENENHPCLISSAKTASNSNCNPSEMSDFSCSSCVSQYLENYNFFLVYAPECRFTDGDGNFADEKGNPYDRFCYIDKKSLFTMSDNYKDSNARDLSEEKVKKQSVYFYQFKHYSTYYRPTYFTYDDDGKQSMHKHYDIVYGQCITNEASDNYMCAYLQNDCGASLNLYCCDSSTGGHCNANSKDVCTGAPSKTHYTCSDIHALDKFNWSGSDTFYIEGNEVKLPTPI